MELIRGEVPSWFGSGSGYGSGSGSGYGSGSGSGYGYGYGSGYGSGYGYGYGYGDGYGYGSGYGDGYGYGSGYGYGDGDGEYARAVIDSSLGSRAADLRSAGATLAFWRSDANGCPANGGSGTKAHVGLVEAIAGPLELCTPRALHATMTPNKWKGERLWIVALYPPIAVDDDKCGSLKREFLAEIPNWYE